MNNYEKNLRNRFKGNFALAAIMLGIAAIYALIENWEEVIARVTELFK